MHTLKRQDQAYVLFMRPQGETSLWLSLLTANYGRLQLTFKGGRKKQTHCPAFTQLSIQWQAGKQGGGWLHTSEIECYQAPLQGMANWSALYANELLHKSLLTEVAQPKLFASYAWLIQQLRLAQTDRAQMAAALRCFEWQLLHEMGYGLATTTHDQQPLLADAHYRWHRYEWREETTGILGRDLLALITQDVANMRNSPALKTLLQGQLLQLLPQQTMSMRHWWEQLT